MSTSFRQIRKNSTAQGRFKDLVRDYQRFLAEQVTVDNPDFKVKLRTMYSKLVYKDPFITHKTKPLTTTFYLTIEPDAQYCVGMWSLDHNGHFAVDASGKGHYGRWLHNPEVKEGIDNGFGTSLYANFDGITNIVYINDFSKLRLSEANYFTITARIYPTDITPSDGVGGTAYRTILHKADTTNLTNSQQGLIDTGSVGNGYHLAVTADGKVRFTLQVAGVKYTVETLANVVIAQDPPLPYEITVTCDQVNKRTIPAEQVLDPGDVPGSGDDEEPPNAPPLIAPRMEISVNNNFYALYTTGHLKFVDDGTLRRLRIGSAYSYPSTHARYLWFKWKGGIQQVRMYNGKVLTLNEIRNLSINKFTIAETPFGSPALAGSTFMLDPNSIPGGFDNEAFESDAFETSDVDQTGLQGFGGFDPIGFDEDGYDTLPVNDQSVIQGGGFNPRGMSAAGFDTLPQSQS